jgi:hypothetical protein
MTEGTKRGFTKKMVEKGLAVVTPNETVSFVKGWPNDFVTLTPMAIEYLQQFDDVDIELDYPKNGMNLVNKNHARHDLFCQKYILQKQKTELFDYQNSRSATKQKSESGVKEPDLILIQGLKNISIEIELTIKKGHELDRFIGSAIKALTDNRFDETHIISDSNAIINKYSKILHDINTRVPIWKMKENRNWYKTDKFITSNSSIAGRIKFYKLNEDGTTELSKSYSTSIIIEDDDDEDDEFDVMSLARNP